ncbi:2240_t:CDS:2, partial [Racocetra persica]
LSYAIPVKDISSTSVGISKIRTFPSTESFAVAVQHVDNLVNDFGDVLAERISAVVINIINIDLRDEQLFVNNVPVPLGVNSIQVIKAKVIPENKDIFKYENNFNSGLITVEVNTVAESSYTEEKGGSLLRLKISIRIVEIDGTKVNQVDDINKAFEFRSLETANDSQNSEIAIIYLKSHSCSMISHFRHWWHSSPWLTQTALVALFFIFFCILFMAIRE